MNQEATDGAGGALPRPSPRRFLLAEPLPFGELTLMTTDYQEFACSKATSVWLQAGGMQAIDGKPVRLKVVDDWGDNVIMGVTDD